MSGYQNVVFVCDPLLSEYGPLRPAILIAEKLLEKGKSVTMVSTTISEKLQNQLDSAGIATRDLRKEPIMKRNESVAWMEAWIREAMFSLNSRRLAKFDAIVVNFSNTICTSAHIWYAQGPPTVTLKNMQKQLPLHYRMVYLSGAPVLKIVDKAFTRRLAECSNRVVANSKYLASLYYSEFCVHVDRVIYPPLDCEEFRPMTAKPSEDFVLTYFGKETVFGLVKSILDAGIKVKAFGGKLSIVPKKLMEHPNLDHVGKISDKELMRLYSNALFTFYPFTDEPFGYIPIESLACGTPVLTYNRQGPKETIINGDTGWLADDDETLLKLASRIWKNGFPRKTRETCRKSALKYDASAIAGKWFEMLDNVYA